MHLPVNDIVPKNQQEGKPFLLQCPCDAELAHQVDDLANEVYENYNPAFNQTEEWRIKNVRLRQARYCWRIPQTKNLCILPN